MAGVFDLQQLFVASLDSRLTEPERRLRAAIQRLMLGAEQPVSVEAAGAALGLGPEQARALAQNLADKRVLVLAPDGRAKFAYPVSALPTAHRVQLGDGRALHAMCAIDALGCQFTFGTPVVVRSPCADCGAPIYVEVRDETGVIADPPTAGVLHLDLNRYPDWAADT